MGLSTITTATATVIATAELTIDTPGEGFIDITAEVRRFADKAAARDGTISLFLRHTSASLTIQENADPDVLRDLTQRIASSGAARFRLDSRYRRPDDMPAHVRTMLTGVSLQIPMMGGHLALGTWQGIYLIEHRARPHRRQIVLQFAGGQRGWRRFFERRGYRFA